MPEKMESASVSSGTEALDDFPPVSPEVWRRRVEEELDGQPFERLLVSRLREGFELPPLFTAEDLPAGVADRGLPGLAPYVRGGRLVGAAAAGWRPAREVASASVEAAGAAIRRDLERGVGLLWLRCDAAGRIGLACDEPAVSRLARRGGLALRAAVDLERLLEGVDLGGVEVVVDAGADALAVAPLLVAAAARLGFDPGGLRGGFGCDPLGALAADGRLPGSLETAFAEAADLTAWCREQAPGMRALAVSASPYHDAGASAVEELAFALASGVEVLRRLEPAGLGVEEVCGQLGFRFSVGPDLFLEIAKLRAARLLWSKAVAACGGSEPAQAMRLDARTSAVHQAARDPWVNLLRTTVESFAAAVGGVDTLAVDAYDALVADESGAAESDERALRVATNVHHLLAEEAHLGRVLDPGGGSYYLEALTERLARAGWELFREVEARGGMARALGDGWVAERIEATVAGRAREVAERRQVIVGVSDFVDLGERPPERVVPAPADTEAMPGPGVQRALEALAAAAGSRSGGVTAAAVAAAEAGATLTQIAARLGRGEPASAPRLPLRRPAEPFERLRAASDRHLAATGRRPRAFLASVGRPADFRARAAFAAGLLAAGGVEAVDDGGFEEPAAAAEAYARSGAELAVICSSDERYPELAGELARALARKGARQVLLAGRPGEREAAYREAGVDGFLYRGCDVIELLEGLLGELGVLP